MLRITEHCREYNNHNITIKYDKDNIENVMHDEMLALSDCLWEIDCYIMGEQFCLSNFEMGVHVYNAFSDVIYILPFSDIEKLKRGKLIRLYARELDNDDIELLKECDF